MDQESPLDLPLLRRLGHGQEIEVVGVFEDLLRHIRLRRWQLALEVGQGLPFPLVQAALDLKNQDILTPAVFERGPRYHSRVGRSLIRSRTLRLWPQGNLAMSDCKISGSGQASAKARIYRKFRGLKPSTPGNSACRSRARRSLILLPHPSFANRWLRSRPMDGEAGPDLGGTDASFELLEEFVVAGGQLKAILHEFSLAQKSPTTSPIV